MVRQAAVFVAASLIAVGMAAFGTASPAHAATVTATGIDATGTQDDTAALQELIDGLPDGSTLSFAPGGRYRIEGTLHVQKKRDLVIEGNGALFFATTTGDRGRSQWSFEGGSNIVVRNVIVKGANPHGGAGSGGYVMTLEAQHAFNIWSTDGLELSHVTATDTYGDFVYVGRQWGRLATNIYVHDSTFLRSGRQGISVTGGDGVRIIHNVINDIQRSTFDLEPNGATWGALNVDIEYNTIGIGRLNLLSSAGTGPVSNVTFAHNRLNRPVHMVVRANDGGRRGPFTIKDNVATQVWGSAEGSAALSFANVDGLTVAGNTIPLQDGRGDYGVKATNSCGVVIRGNSFPGAVTDSYVTPGPGCATQAPVSTPAPTTSSAPLPPPTSVVTTTPPATASASATPYEPTMSASTSPSASASATQKPAPASTHAAAGNAKKPAHPSPQDKHDAAVTTANQQVPPGSDGGSATIDLAAATTSTSSLFSARNLATGGAALLLIAFIAFRLFRRRPRLARTARRHPTRVPTGPFATEVLPQRFAR